MKGEFCVYEHWRPDIGQCFYVGKGQTRRRPRETRYRNDLYRIVKDTIEALGLTIEIRIFAVGLSERRALNLEKERIAHWRGRGVELANKTDGGEGFSGFVRPLGIRLSPEARRKMSEARKGIKFTAEHRAKLAARKVGVRRKPFTKETIERMRAASQRREALKREKYGYAVTRWTRLT